MTKNFYNLPPPWNPGFQIPNYVMDEPVARGTFTTLQMPRGTISADPGDFRRVPMPSKGLGSLGGSSLSGSTLGGSSLSGSTLGGSTLGAPVTGAIRPTNRKGPRKHHGIPFDPGFVVPDYVRAESYGQGAYGTQWLPRGTISQRIPEFGQPNLGTKILDRPDAGLGSLGDDTLGAGVGGRNPIAKYGQDSASWIMHSIKSVPETHRPAALRALFDAIDPGLSSKVQTETAKLREKGVAAKPALQQGIATAMSTGMQKEIINTGRGQRPPTRGHVALGAVPGARSDAKRYALEALGFGFSDLNPVPYLAKAGVAVAQATGLATKPTLGEVAKFAAKGVDVVGGLACDVISSDVGKAAVVTAATAYGGPVGGAAAYKGVDVGRDQCGGGKPSKITVSLPPLTSGSSRPSWLVPAVVGVGIFGVGALLMGRK